MQEEAPVGESEGEKARIAAKCVGICVINCTNKNSIVAAEEQSAMINGVY